MQAEPKMNTHQAQNASKIAVGNIFMNSNHAKLWEHEQMWTTLGIAVLNFNGHNTKIMISFVSELSRPQFLFPF